MGEKFVSGEREPVPEWLHQSSNAAIFENFDGLCNLLVVCTGNICRSPYAAARITQVARSVGIRINVVSAGTQACIGQPASDEMSAVAAARDLDLSEHRARQLTGRIASEADIILVCDESHSDWLVQYMPEYSKLVIPLGMKLPSEKKWIQDPYGYESAVFVQVANHIDACVNAWFKDIS